MCDQLSWSHYRTLLSLPDENMIEYYIKIIIEQELSVRELRKLIAFFRILGEFALEEENIRSRGDFYKLL